VRARARWYGTTYCARDASRATRPRHTSTLDMPRETRRSTKRRDSGGASIAGGCGANPTRARASPVAKRAKREPKGRRAEAVDAVARGDDRPSTSARSGLELSERDVLSALGERAVSNSVPASVLEKCAEEDVDDEFWDGCSELTSSQGTSAKTSSLRARRALPGLRLPNEAFDGDRAEEGDREIESGFMAASDGETKLPEDGWIQPCFACSRWTWQNVALGGFKVYRCASCAETFRSRATAMKPRDGGTTDATAGDEGAEAKGDVLASLVLKLRAIVDQVGGEHLKRSLMPIE